MKRRPKSIAFLIGTILLAVVSTTLALFAVLDYTQRRRDAIADLAAHLNASITQLASGLVMPIWNVDPPQIAANIEALLVDPNILSATLSTREETYYFTCDDSGEPFRIDTPVAAPPDALTFTRPIAFAGRSLGELHVVASSHLMDLQLRAVLRRQLIQYLLLDCILVSVLYLLLKFLVINPLKALESYAASFSDEVGPSAPAHFGRSRFFGELQTLRDSIIQLFSLLTARYRDLRGSRERLQLATQAAAIGVWDWDIVKNVLTWDENMRVIYGMPRDESVDCYADWKRSVHPEDLPFAEAEVQAALHGEREFTPEFRILWPDGSLHHIKAASLTFRAPDGKPVRMVGINYDVTKRRHTEEELARYRDHLQALVDERTAELLLARDAAEAANQTKSLFLASMSHELRTPLNAVLGFSQLLEQDGTLSPEAQSKVATIMKSGDHLLSIINDILDMSRIEAGRVELQRAPLDLYSLLDNLAVMFRLRTEEKGLSFNIEYPDDLPGFILGDVEKLSQVLTNLLGNAIKFTQKGFVSVHIAPGLEERIIVEVRDSGIGISPTEQAKLFLPFERTRSGEQIAGGTGLGLAISREYAHLMGGEITVESRVGEGSCFRFEFQAPATTLVPTNSKSSRTGIRLAPDQAGTRVLVVDDLPINRTLLRDMLEPLGFQVEEACDGQEAIAKATANPPG